MNWNTRVGSIRFNGTSNSKAGGIVSIVFFFTLSVALWLGFLFIGFHLLKWALLQLCAYHLTERVYIAGLIVLGFVRAIIHK